MDILLQIIFIMILFELLELYLHQADTLIGLIDKLYGYCTNFWVDLTKD